MTVQNQTSNLDWDDARFFLAAYRQGSLIGAARSLGVSHSTVKRRLDGLEQSLGAQLFTPTKNGLLPTDAALAAIDIAEQVEQAAIQFGDRLMGASRDVSGTLVVTTVDGVAGMLGPVVRGYTDRFPKVALKLITDNRFLDLRRREADIAVRITNSPEDDLFGRRVGHVDYRPFASPRLAKAHGERLTAYPWILWDHSAGAVGTESWFQQNVGARPPEVRVVQTSVMASLSSAGVGAAILPEPIGESAGLVPIGDRIEGFRTDIWCLCHQDLRNSERIRGFMEETASSLDL